MSNVRMAPETGVEFTLAKSSAGSMKRITSKRVRPVLTRALLALLLTAGCAGNFSGPALAAPLQCVPYARDHSGIDIHGNAWTWWEKAKGLYARGSIPRIGAVLAMARSQAMPLGHVAVVRKIVDARHILLDHANWSSRGKIERGVMAEDVSFAGDWSEVRVWYAPSASLGMRTNPVSGFIYPDAPDIEFAAAPADDDAAAG